MQTMGLFQNEITRLVTCMTKRLQYYLTSYKNQHYSSATIVGFVVSAIRRSAALLQIERRQRNIRPVAQVSDRGMKQGRLKQAGADLLMTSYRIHDLLRAPTPPPPTNYHFCPHNCRRNLYGGADQRSFYVPRRTTVTAFYGHIKYILFPVCAVLN